MSKNIPDLLAILFGQQGKPIRRDIELRLTVDDDGNPIIAPVDGNAFNLSPEGSVDILRLRPDRFHHCGHSADQPIGGRCAENGCGRISCVACFANCARCGKPLCREHARLIESEALGVSRGGQMIIVCPPCHSSATSSRQVRAVVRGLLRPFIAFDERESRR